MKFAIWFCFALLSLAWTGCIWAAAEMTRWIGDLVAAGGAVDGSAAAGTIQFPGWLTWWIDPVLIESIIDGAVWVLETANHFMPWLAQGAGWLVALLWLVWGAGMLMLLLLAGLLHALVSRSPQPGPDAAHSGRAQVDVRR